MEGNLTSVAAALAIGIAALATGYAQARIGAAAVAALTEKKEIFGMLIVLMAIPETMVILGFVIAYLLLR